MLMLYRHFFLLTISMLAISFASRSLLAQEKFVPPSSGRVTYNFNPGWKFIKHDVTGSEAPAFDDAKWENVSTPHTWNDVDSYDEHIARGGEVTLYMGPARYRKHFKLPAAAEGSRIILEFEGLRQAAKFWVNGKPVGKHEDGITAFGLDITDAVTFGDKENVLAAWVTNVTNYQEEATGVVFQWESKDFNPNFGGINRNVRLHIIPPIHQTLPLLNLGTTGVYVYATNHDVPGKKATLNIESQVRNGSTGTAVVELSTIVVDADGNTIATFKSEPYDMANGETTLIKATGPLTNVRWWSTTDPNLYDVYTILNVAGKVVDVNKVTTGFRKTAFKGGAGTGGVYINDQFTWLTGYAQRSTNEWAAIGAAYPDWLHDWDMKFVAAGHGNYMRWMHVAPKKQLSDACDRVGIVQVCPAGDKEANPTNPIQWDQRMEVMRRTMIYFRNSPSILFWEAGNNAIAPERLQAMVDLRKQLDPSGGRVMGTRHGDNSVLAQADTHISEYYGVMIAQDRSTEALANPNAIFRGFSYERRDLAPFIETEDFRDEALRTYWDDFSPPHFGFKKGPNDTYNWNSETFCLAAATRYYAYWSHRITLNDPKMARWSAYASIIWSDSLQLGRNPDTEVARSSGKVDGVRIPKQAYFVYRVMQNPKPDIHIIGHWTYPAETKKTMYVAANNVSSVELLINGKSVGKNGNPKDGYIYAFPDVAFAAGTIKAVAYDKDGKPVVEHELKTAGPAAAIKLTPYSSPTGLMADGADIAFFDFEVVDADGNRCPTDQSRFDFELTGPAIWRGGVNEYTPGSINNKYLNTECGINRVFVRSTLTPGAITLTATREGLPKATINIESKPIAITGGLIRVTP